MDAFDRGVGGLPVGKLGPCEGLEVGLDIVLGEVEFTADLSFSASDLGIIGLTITAGLKELLFWAMGLNEDWLDSR